MCLMPHDDYDDEYGEQSDVKVNESKEAVLHDLESVPLWSGDPLVIDFKKWGLFSAVIMPSTTII